MVSHHPECIFTTPAVVAASTGMTQ